MTVPAGRRSKKREFHFFRTIARPIRVQGGVAVLLAACLAALSVLANVLQLAASGGLWAWVAVAAAAAITLLVLLSARPLLRKNIRGAWLFNVVRQSGLVDIEDRSDKNHRVPPAQVFTLPHIRCVMISGVLDQLFQNFKEDVNNFMQSGGEVRVLLIHPQMAADSLESSWVRHREDWVGYWKTNCNESQIAVDAIIQSGLDKLPGFHIRFMRELPPYFGILATNSFHSDSFGSQSFVRVQPLTCSQYVGRGVVLTLERTPASANSPFQYFAVDLLNQWQVAIVDHRFLEGRRRTLGL